MMLETSEIETPDCVLFSNIRAESFVVNWEKKEELTELLMKKQKQNNWKRVYLGKKDHFVLSRFNSNTVYELCIRYVNQKSKMSSIKGCVRRIKTLSKDSENLLSNPSFDSKGLSMFSNFPNILEQQDETQKIVKYSPENWKVIMGESVVVNTKDRGNILMIKSTSVTSKTMLFQHVYLNQSTPRDLYVSAETSSKHVNAEKNRGYALIVDVIYMDDSYGYGGEILFNTRSNDWYQKCLIIQTVEKIKFVQVHLVFASHLGMVWFDNIVLKEINTVDSSYEKCLIAKIRKKNLINFLLKRSDLLLVIQIPLLIPSLLPLK